MIITTAAEALSHISNGDRVYIHTAAATPQYLVREFSKRTLALDGVEVIHMHTEGEASYVDAPGVKVTALFVGKNIRHSLFHGNGDYLPIFLSDIPRLFRQGLRAPNVALIQVSPPDSHGFCSLGVSVDASKAAVDVASLIIAQINPQMPRTHGDGIIHKSAITYGIEMDEPMYSPSKGPLTDVDHAIGKHVASLVEDGATLQMGIGSIPDAVMPELTHHRNLGIHTEMMSDGILSLVEAGVINGSCKRTHPGKIVSSFAMGSREFYDFIDDNPSVLILDVAYVNDTAVIRRNPRVTAINSAIEVDITGQICADSIGTTQYSGVGGQMDFMRGAALSEGGKPIIALPSLTAKGFSKIVPALKLGANVTTTRAHAHYVVTEFGIASLFGRTLKERARALINIAHPDSREFLEQSAFERFGSVV